MLKSFLALFLPIFILCAVALACANPARAGSSACRHALADAPTISVDWNACAFQSVTLGGNRAFTFSNPSDGGRYILKIRQDATGGRTVAWPATVRWPGGTAPDLASGAGKATYFQFIYDAEDRAYDGFFNGRNY